MAWPILIGMVVVFLALWFVGSSPKIKAKLFGDETGSEQPLQLETKKIGAAKPAPSALVVDGHRRNVMTKPTLKPTAFIDATQYGANCKAVTRKPTRDPRWKQNLSLSVPEEAMGVTIPMYQIQWFSGSWSKPFTPGDGDIDWKDNGPGLKRRVWSYFFDHNHRFVACDSNAGSFTADAIPESSGH